tara:strand:+ start:65 stop:376 length:312 start_codon:yes stop_codon:yes gene_type:complete
MSNKQISELVQNTQTFMEQTIQAFGVVDNDLRKLNFLLFALLREMGKVEDVKCSNCDNPVVRPIVEGLPKQNECPICGEDLFAGSQTTVEDWDSGLITNDESE